MAHAEDRLAAAMPRPRSLAFGGAILLAACRAPVLPPAPPRASEWGLGAATSGSAPARALPSMTMMCRDVFAAQLADIDAERIHVASPTPACEPVVRELARRPGS
jgi:hypothetical protein